MFIFSLFELHKAKNIRYQDINKKYKLDDGRWISFESATIDTTMYSYISIASSAADSRQTGHMIIRFQTGIALLDTKEDFLLAQTILDFLESNFKVKFIPLGAPIEDWVDFLLEGEITRALIATRTGLNNIVESVNLTRNKLISHPIVSASATFVFNGPFQVRIGSGLLTIYEDADFNRVLHVVSLLEKHLLNGENMIESKTSE